MTYSEERQRAWKGPEHWMQCVRSPPATWQTPHTSLMLTSSPPEHCMHIGFSFCFYGNIIIFCIKKCHVLTWVLLAGAFVGATALVRVVDGSVKKKEETSVMSLLEVELLCRASAGRNCKTQNWFTWRWKANIHNIYIAGAKSNGNCHIYIKYYWYNISNC